MEEVQPREEVIRFARAMEQRMRENDKEKGESWKKMTNGWLLGRVFGEIGEYLMDDADWELVDAANFLMMMWSNNNG